MRAEPPVSGSQILIRRGAVRESVRRLWPSCGQLAPRRERARCWDQDGQRGPGGWRRREAATLTTSKRHRFPSNWASDTRLPRLLLAVGGHEGRATIPRTAGGTSRRSLHTYTPIKRGRRPADKPTEQEAKEPLYSVLDLVHGDTIRIELNSRSEALRLIGLDTPNTQAPRKPV